MNDAYLKPYQDAQAQHGSDFDVTMWARPETQRRRFEVFSQVLFLEGKTILDAGCSRGDFAAYLLERGVSYGQFIGIDGLDEVIAFARGRDLPDSRFEVGDFVKQPEWLATGSPQVVSISGSLNTMDIATAIKVLEGAWSGCREALVFNFLSDRCGPGAPPQKYPAQRLPLMELLDWSLAKTSNVQLRQDYFDHGHDATLLLKKVSIT